MPLVNHSFLSANLQRWDLSKSQSKLKVLEAVLERLEPNRRLLVLCHNNPDPDSIAGAMGLSYLLSHKFGIRSSMGYGGLVTRAENKAMMQRLRIRMTPLSSLGFLENQIALVDAQPGTGNNLVSSRHAPPLIVIDHHPLRKLSLKAEYRDIRPQYGATSTIIAEYLVAAELTPPRSVANALLYGLKTDTNSLGRSATKADFYAFSFLTPLTNPRVLGWIEKPPLDLQYFEDYYKGLSRTLIYRDVAIAYLGQIGSEAIVPELADLLLRLESVCWSFCLAEIGDVMVVSLRSTSRKYRAGNVLRRLIGRMGSAGGHREMAGGAIPLGAMTPTDRQELHEKLINKLLTLIDRHTLHPKKMVAATHASD